MSASFPAMYPRAPGSKPWANAVVFGDRGQYGVGVRIQHISNGSIKEPNDGVTFGELRISYRWD